MLFPTLGAAKGDSKIKVSGWGTSTLTGLQENSDGSLLLTAEQVGYLFNVGAFTGEVSYLATFPAANLTTLTGQGTFTVPNGDRLFFNVTFNEHGVDYPLPFQGTLSVTGGTGRFAGAQGILKIGGTDGEGDTDPFKLEGSLSGIGSGKP